MTKTTKITFYASIALFVICVILFGLSLLDAFNIVDYYNTSSIAFFISIVFFVGVLLILTTLLQADETFSNLKTIKIIFSLYILVLVLLPLTILLLFRALPFATLLVVPLLFIYLFDISWSKSKKIWFAIGNLFFNVLASAILWFISVMNIHDGGLS